MIYQNIVVDGVCGFYINYEDGVEVYNNVAYNCGSSFQTTRNLSSGTYYAVNLKNNISYNPQNAHIEFSSGSIPMNSDYNLFFPNDELLYFTPIAGSTGVNLETWQTYSFTGCVFDPNSHAVDPLFVNTSGTFSEPEDFQLSFGSPAINAGTDVGLTTDFGGNPIVETPDIGAWESQSVNLTCNIKAFLEGPFNGSGMNTDLNPTIIPLSQPYNVSPWNYSGTETVAAIPADVVDWVLVEFRDAADAESATSATMIQQQAAFILNNGSIITIDGSSDIALNQNIDQSLFVVVFHRNHLAIMSANPLTETGGVYTYDFTTPEGQANGTDAQKNLGSGLYGMYAGDSDANGTVESGDKIIWGTQAGLKGYFSGDYNMNGQVTNQDKNEIWFENNGKAKQVPE